MNLYAKLNPQMALIFRITHVDNVPWILENGLHCSNSIKRDPSFVNIGNDELIGKRKTQSMPLKPGGVLGDYIPFYFTPFSPMMLNIKTGHGGIRQRPNREIVILVSTLHLVATHKIQFVFTDGHASLVGANFYSKFNQLDEIDWKILQARDFKRDLNDPGKFGRYQAEALIYQHLPLDALSGIICCVDSVNDNLQQCISECGLKLATFVRPTWYFQ